MKEIIHNNDNLTEKDCHNIVKRAKLIVENSKQELLFVVEDNNMFLIGGHVENNELDNNTLIREIKEEAGIDFNPNVDKPFLCIKYLTKDYPEVNKNTLYITNFYFLKSDELIPNVNNLNLTKEEQAHGFHLEYIPKEQSLLKLKEVSKTVTKVRGAVLDTIDAIEEYLKEY